jgi:His-Xaa-Ser system protein HxsD
MVITPIDETTIQIKIDNTLYSSEVVHKCFYWYAGKYSVEINTEQNSIVINLSSPNKEWDIESVVSKVKTDLIDFKTREMISTETKNIREMLIAKAFAHNDEFEEQPSGNINDPVGFDPSKI